MKCGMQGRFRATAARAANSPLARQAAGLTGGRAAAGLLSLVWLTLATRSLSVPEFADLALVLSVGAVMSVLSDFGLPLILNDAVAAEPARGRATLAMVIRRRMLLGVVAAAATVAFYLLAADDKSLAVPGTFAVSLLATAWYTSCSAALRGAGRVGPEALNEVLSRLFVLIVGSILVTNGAGLVAVVSTYAAADVLSAAGLTLVSSHYLSGKMPVDRSRFELRRIAPLGIAAVTSIVYYRIDVWLLALMAGTDEVAAYSVCYRLIEALILPAGVVAVVTIRSIAGADDTFAIRKADRMAKLLCVCLAPAVLILEAFPGTVLRLGFGSFYSSGAPVLQILGLAVLPSVVILTWAPVVALRSRGLLAITAGSLVGNVVLNLAFVPHIGAQGAAIATVIGQLAFAICLRWNLQGLIRQDPVSSIQDQVQT